MAEVTPTTERIRAMVTDGIPAGEPYRTEAGEQFDRWLAEHDREVALKCAERALEWMRTDFEGPHLPGLWEFVRDGLGTEWREHESQVHGAVEPK